jgi:thiamine-monophosphate kinase
LKEKTKILAASIGGGDDYELLFTARPSMTDRIGEAMREAGIMVTGIGTMEAGQGVHVCDDDGKEMAVAKAGYSHF